MINEHPITRASLNLTRNCNLRCTYPCFTNGCTFGSMPLDIAKKCVDLLFEGAKHLTNPNERQVEISFWGGEPLLEWSLLQKTVYYAKEKSAQDAVPVNFGGTTNGTLLTNEKFDFLDTHRIFFLVSIDGMEETHNTHRKYATGKGSHFTIMRNMEDVLARWPFYKVRMGLTADNVGRFYEDCRYLFDFGFDHIMFSPIYEGDWDDEKWSIWEQECYKVIDYMAIQKNRQLSIEHFKSYISIDNSRWPCGAGRFYVGFDIDGSIYPCHRFNKFDDNSPWQEKEVCIGHVEVGITKPEFRQTFIDFNPQCGECPRLQDTPCHGGCYAVNYDFNKDITKPHSGVCKYVEIQKKVSEYYASKLPINPIMKGSCICDNMCYAENTPNEIITLNPNSGDSCICNMTKYTGPTTQGIANPLNPKYGGMYG